MNAAAVPNKAVLVKELSYFAVAGLVLLTLSLVTIPRIDTVVLKTDAGRTVPLAMPVIWTPPGIGKDLQVSFVVHFKHGNSSLIRLYADDCISKIRQNGEPIFNQPCQSVSSFLEINLGKAARLGPNIVEVTIRNTYSKRFALDAGISPSDPFSMILRLFRFVFILIGTLWILRRVMNIETPTLLIALGGILIRGIYVFGTSAGERAHDFIGHVEYLRHAATHFLSVPVTGTGGEYFQPPLYYWLASPVLHFGAAVGWTEATCLELLQDTALATSALTLIAGLWVGTLLFGKEKTPFRLFALLLAAFPALILLSPRVSNDPLVLLLTIIGFGFMILFWQRPFSPKILYAAVAAFALAFLSKANGVALLPVLMLCLLLKPNVPKTLRIRHTLGCVFLFLALVGWYPAVRLAEGSESMSRLSTFGANTLSPELLLDYTPRNFLTFHPGVMVLFPYNRPFGDLARRSNYFEYFFRSALFGEFTFRHTYFLAPLLALLGCLLLPWVVAGSVEESRLRFAKNFPLLLSSASVMGAAILCVILNPYVPAQDFRYSALLVIPLAYYAVKGMQGVSKEFRYLGMIVAIVFAAASAWFYAMQ